MTAVARKVPYLTSSRSCRAGKRKRSGKMNRPGMRKTCRSRRRLTTRFTSNAKARRPARSPMFRKKLTALTVCSCCCLVRCLLLPRQVQHLRQPRHDSRKMKERAERRPVTASHQQGRDQSGFAQSGTEEFSRVRALQSPRRLLLPPDGGLRQEGPYDHERDGRQHPEHQRVAPSLLAPSNRGQVLTVCHREVIGDGDEQPADGR